VTIINELREYIRIELMTSETEKLNYLLAERGSEKWGMKGGFTEEVYDWHSKAVQAVLERKQVGIWLGTKAYTYACKEQPQQKCRRLVEVSNRNRSRDDFFGKKDKQSRELSKQAKIVTGLVDALYECYEDAAFVLDTIAVGRNGKINGEGIANKDQAKRKIRLICENDLEPEWIRSYLLRDNSLRFTGTAVGNLKIGVDVGGGTMTLVIITKVRIATVEGIEQDQFRLKYDFKSSKNEKTPNDLFDDVTVSAKKMVKMQNKALRYLIALYLTKNQAVKVLAPEELEAQIDFLFKLTEKLQTGYAREFFYEDYDE